MGIETAEIQLKFRPFFSRSCRPGLCPGECGIPRRPSSSPISAISGDSLSRERALLTLRLRRDATLDTAVTANLFVERNVMVLAIEG